MVLLNFSFTGENSTGAQAFTLINEYKFLKRNKYKRFCIWFYV